MVDYYTYPLITSNIIAESLDTDKVFIAGRHNLENCMAAALIAYVSNINIDTIREVLKTFAGVEHRQEFVRNLNGVMFVNDSKATNPEASVVAIDSFNKEDVALILGGRDKNTDLTQMCESINKKVLALHRSKIGEISVKDLKINGNDLIKTGLKNEEINSRVINVEKEKQEQKNERKQIDAND